MGVISILLFLTFSYHHPLCETIFVPLPFQGHSRVSHINGALWHCVRWDASLWVHAQTEICEDPDVPETNWIGDQQEDSGQKMKFDF